MIYQQDRTSEQLGGLVQRLLQLDTYRLMATLGLPLAQTINSELNQLDLQLQEVTTCIAFGTEKNDRELLTQVSTTFTMLNNYANYTIFQWSN